LVSIDKSQITKLFELRFSFLESREKLFTPTIRVELFGAQQEHISGSMPLQQKPMRYPVKRTRPGGLNTDLVRRALYLFADDFCADFTVRRFRAHRSAVSLQYREI
jgi:hypothetical protein